MTPFTYDLPLSYGDPAISFQHNKGPYTHMAMLLSDVNTRRKNGITRFVLPMSIWLNDPMSVSFYEKMDMVYCGMTGGEQI